MVGQLRELPHRATAGKIDGLLRLFALPVTGRQPAWRGPDASPPKPD